MGHKITWGTVEAQLQQNQLGTIETKTVWVQLGYCCRADERKVVLGTVEAHSVHTFLLGTVGTGLKLTLG